MPSLWVIVLIAYYLVGVVLLWKEIRSIPKDDRAIQMFSAQIEKESTASFIWIGIKLTLHLIFIHIPCWIFRV